ncbi:MAG: MBL fold metallo-hydrolase [Clostridiaceae bacterium]|nr:MBL fold metallo-hydrolase [Clostridiaceae bacterium]
MLFKKIVVGALGTCCYVLGDEENVIVVDPGDEGERIYDYIVKKNLNVTEIVLTHGHFDHIGAVGFLKEKTNATVSIHEADSEMLSNTNKNLAANFTGENITAPKADRFLHDGDIVKAGKYELTVIHTPGHSPGGICLFGNKILISGDTLFKGTIGRYDFGNFRELLQSVGKLMKLPKDTRVFPGHGEETTIMDEILFNPYLRNELYGY